MSIFFNIFKITIVMWSMFVGVPSVFAISTGFTSSQVSLSPLSVQEGENVRISVSFANHEDALLTGKISFYNKDILLGSRELSLESGQAGEFFIDWQAALGEHSFTARAESLRLEGTAVAILGPETQPKVFEIGFKNSSFAEKLRSQGNFGAVVAGIIDETKEFFIPIIESLDIWRLSRINPLETTRERLDVEKEGLEEGKIKPILTIHFLFVGLILFIVNSKTAFFGLVILVVCIVLIRVVRLFKKIIRKDYSTT